MGNAHTVGGGQKDDLSAAKLKGFESVVKRYPCVGLEDVYAHYKGAGECCGGVQGGADGDDDDLDVDSITDDAIGDIERTEGGSIRDIVAQPMRQYGKQLAQTALNQAQALVQGAAEGGALFDAVPKLTEQLEQVGAPLVQQLTDEVARTASEQLGVSPEVAKSATNAFAQKAKDMALPFAQKAIDRVKRSIPGGCGCPFTGGADDVEMLKSYVNSHYSKSKEQLIRDIAADISSVLGVNTSFAKSAPIGKVVEKLKHIVPDPRLKTKIVSDKQERVCREVAKAINARFKHDLIDQDASPAVICHSVGEVVYSLFVGLHSEFLTVAGDVTRIIKNLRGLQEYIDAAFKTIKSEVDQSTTDVALTRRVDNIQAIYEKMRTEFDRQVEMLKNIVNVSIEPTSKTLLSLLDDTKTMKGLVADLKDALGTERFSDKLGYMLVGISTTARAAELVNKALKEVGMTLKEYKAIPLLKDLRLELHKLIAEQRPDSHQLMKLMDALDILYKNDYIKEDVVAHLERKKSGRSDNIYGAAERKTNDENDIYNMADDDVYGAAEGGIEIENLDIDTDANIAGRRFLSRKSLSKRVAQQDKAREILFHDLNKIIQHHFQSIVTAVHRVAPRIGNEIPLSDELDTFVRRFTEVPSADRENLHKALSGYRKDVSSKYIKNEFMASLHVLSDAAEQLVIKSSKYTESFKEIKDAIDSLIMAIDEFNDVFVRSLTDLHIDVSVEGGAEKYLREIIIRVNPEAFAHFVTFKQAQAELYYYYRIAGIKKTMGVMANEMTDYHANYENILGDEVGHMIGNITEEYNKAVHAADYLRSDIEEIMMKPPRYELCKLFRNGITLATKLLEKFSADVAAAGAGATQGYCDYIYSLASRCAWREFDIGTAPLQPTVAANPRNFHNADNANITSQRSVRALAYNLCNVMFSGIMDYKNANDFRRIPGLYVHGAEIDTNLGIGWQAGAGHAPEADVVNIKTALQEAINMNKERHRVYLAMLKYQRDAKIQLLKTAEAVDLYLQSFTDGINAHPEEVTDLLKILEQIDIVARWFNDQSGNNLARLFESWPTALDKTLVSTPNAALDHINGELAPMGEDGVAPASRVIAAGDNNTEHYYNYIINQTRTTAAQDCNANVFGDVRNGMVINNMSQLKGILQHINKCVRGVHALENIISTFAGLGKKFGSKEPMNKTFMPPGEMFKSLIDYMVASSICMGRDPDRSSAIMQAASTAYWAGGNANFNAPAGAPEVVRVGDATSWQVVANPTAVMPVAAVPAIDGTHGRIPAAFIPALNAITSMLFAHDGAIIQGAAPAAGNTSRYRRGFVDGVIGAYGDIIQETSGNINATAPGPSGFAIAGLPFTNAFVNNPVVSDFAITRRDAHKGIYPKTLDVEDQLEVVLRATDSDFTGTVRDRFMHHMASNKFNTYDTIFSHVIKSIIGKIFTTIGVFSMFNRPQIVNEFNSLSPLRMILGGADSDVEAHGFPEVIEEAIELYIRLPLLAEWYREKFNFNTSTADTQSYKISMVPSADGIFSDFIALIFRDVDYVKDGTYTNSALLKLIYVINEIYNAYRPKKYSSKDIILAFIVEVNRRYGIIKQSEINTYLKNVRANLSSTDEYKDEPVRIEFDILDEKSGVGRRPAPSDRFQEVGTRRLRRKSTRDELIGVVTAFRESIERDFAEVLRGAGPAGRYDYKEIKFSFEGSIKQARTALELAQDPKARYEIIAALIQGIERYTRVEAEKLLAFNELVATPLTVLNMVHELLYNFNTFIHACRMRELKHHFATNHATIAEAAYNSRIKSVYPAATLTADRLRDMREALNQMCPQSDIGVNTHVATVYYNNVMFRLLNALFSVGTDLSGLTELRVLADGTPMIDYSRLQELCVQLYQQIRTIIDRFRPTLPASIVRRYEHKENGGVFFLEENMFEILFNNRDKLGLPEVNEVIRDTWNLLLAKDVFGSAVNDSRNRVKYDMAFSRLVYWAAQDVGPDRDDSININIMYRTRENSSKFPFKLFPLFTSGNYEPKTAEEIRAFDLFRRGMSRGPGMGNDVVEEVFNVSPAEINSHNADPRFAAILPGGPFAPGGLLIPPARYASARGNIANAVPFPHANRFDNVVPPNAMSIPGASELMFKPSWARFYMQGGPDVLSTLEWNPDARQNSLLCTFNDLVARYVFGLMDTTNDKFYLPMIETFANGVLADEVFNKQAMRDLGLDYRYTHLRASRNVVFRDERLAYINNSQRVIDTCHEASVEIGAPCDVGTADYFATRNAAVDAIPIAASARPLTDAEAQACYVATAAPVAGIVAAAVAAAGGVAPAAAQRMQQTAFAACAAITEAIREFHLFKARSYHSHLYDLSCMRDDFAPQALFASLATCVHGIVTAQNKAGGKLFGTNTMTDISYSTREKMRATLPIFEKMIGYIVAKASFIKELIESPANIPLDREFIQPAGIDAGGGVGLASLNAALHVSVGATWGPAAYPVLNPVTAVPVYGSNLIPQSDGAGGAIPAGIRAAAGTNAHSGRKTHLTEIIRRVIGGAQNLLKCVQVGQRELNDIPLYMELSEDSIRDFQAMYGKQPLMPISSMTTLITNTNKLKLEFTPGSNMFKMLYATRLILGKNNIEPTIEYMPGMKNIINDYDAIVDVSAKIGGAPRSPRAVVNRAAEVVLNTVKLTRYLSDVYSWKAFMSNMFQNVPLIGSQFAIRTNAIPHVAIADHVPIINSMPRRRTYFQQALPTPFGFTIVQHTLNTAALAPSIPAVVNAPGALAGTYNYLALTDAVRITPYQHDAEFGADRSLQEVLLLTETGNLTTNMERIAKRINPDVNAARALTNRSQMRVLNILDMNIVPINVHALQREIPLINLHNYSYTFDRMIQEFIIPGQYPRAAAPAGAPPVAQNYIIAANDPSVDTAYALCKMLIHPYNARGGVEYYHWIPRLMAGDTKLDLGVPKYLSDQLWNKVLLNTSTFHWPNDEAGPRSEMPLFRGRRRMRTGVIHPNDPRAHRPGVESFERTDPARGIESTFSDETGKASSSTAYVNADVTDANVRSGILQSYQNPTNRRATRVIPQLGPAGVTIRQVANLIHKGKERYDTHLIRNLEWIVNLQRVMRLIMRDHLRWVATPVVSGLAVSNRNVTEYTANNTIASADNIDMEYI